jgi:23S rRNA pseudouridine955/2504/2580 synthase
LEEKFIIQDDNVRLDRYIRRLFPGLCQSVIEKSLRTKLITLDGEKTTSSVRVQNNQVLYINKSIYKKETETKFNVSTNFSNNTSNKLVKLIRESIIYEDENILIINKPFDMPVQSGSKIKYSIDKLIKNIDPNLNVVHRLDKHTTGVLIFAKNSKTTTEFWNIFKNRLIRKKYLAIVVGNLKQKSGQVKNFIKKSIVSGEEIMQCNDEDGDLAITNFKVIKDYKNASLIELIPETGRKHQLRVHMTYLGHPILCDGKYGRKEAFLDRTNKRMNLHASSVEFKLFDKNLKIEAKVPHHFQYNLNSLADKN